MREELGGTRVDVNVMTPLKPWDFGEKWLTNQATFSQKRLGPLPDDSPDPYPLLIGFFLGWRQVDVTLMHTELISISWLFKRCSQKRDKSWNPEMLQLMSLDTTQCTDPKTSQAADRIFSKSSKELPNCAPKPTRINENRSCEDLWDTQNLTLRFEDRNT